MENVIIITHEFFPFPGGIAVYVREMAEALAVSGRSVEVWCPDAPELHAEKLPYQILPLAPFSPRKRIKPKLEDTVALWKDRAHDIEHSTVWIPEPGPLKVALFRNRDRLPIPQRLILTLHGSEILNFSRTPLHRVLMKSLFRQAERIGVVSHYVAALLQKHLRAPQEKVRVVSGALRSGFASEISRDRTANDEFVITIVARIHPRKGHHLLLEAIARLPQSLREKVRVQIVGRTADEAYLQQLRSLANRELLNVDFLGEISDEQLPKIYAESDLFAMTSVALKESVEGFGLVYLEASASGLPILAHDCGGVREAVLNEQTGLLVSPDDPAALTDALRRLIESPELRAQLAANGQRHVAQFSWKQNVSALFD